MVLASFKIITEWMIRERSMGGHSISAAFWLCCVSTIIYRGYHYNISLICLNLLHCDQYDQTSTKLPQCMNSIFFRNNFFVSFRSRRTLCNGVQVVFQHLFWTQFEKFVFSVHPAFISCTKKSTRCVVQCVQSFRVLALKSIYSRWKHTNH